jgi:succinylglutamate desuccinylase
MYKTICRATGGEIEFERLVGEAGKAESGPTVIFTLGIHGNEPTGLEAFARVLKKLDDGEFKSFSGRLVGIAGNLEALQKGMRYIDTDLNRNWSDEAINNPDNTNEAKQKSEIGRELIKYKNEADIAGQKFYHFDLHTTSAESKPFSIINEKYRENIIAASTMPVSKVIGMHPYQEMTMTDYWNTKGYTSYLFEAGQHDSLSAVENHESFIWLQLFEKDIIDKETNEDLYFHHRNSLSKYVFTDSVYFEVCHCHKIKPEDNFKMKLGYTNLDEIKKGEILASDNNGEIKAPLDGKIFMPLYQKQGNDGFFIVCATDDPLE